MNIKTKMYKYKILTLAFAMWTVAGLASAATFTLNPSSGSYASGNTFTVSVLLDTSGASIDGVDVRYLHFNPNVLQVVDSNSSASGVQVAPGTLMPSTLTNTVDNTAGTITFSQIVAGGQHYSGAGTLFTVTFQTISGGTGTLSFDAVSGRTTDSNIASNGADILSSAGTGSYTITGAVVSTPTPSPTPSGAGGSTPSPSPTPTGSNPTPSPSGTPTSSPTPAGSCSAGPSLTRTVYVGMSGADVTLLQNFLIQNGYLSAGNNSGFFGQLTRAAVQKFQCAKGLSCSGDESSTGYGLVGAKTRGAIVGSCGTGVTPTPAGNSSLLLTRTVMMGARGVDITSLQNVLISKGYLSAGNNSGYFGALTRAAVQKFQCEKLQVCSGSEATTGYGLVGARTRAALSQ